MKKTVSIFLALMLIMSSVFVLSAYAADTDVKTSADGLYQYRLTNSGKNAEIVEYTGDKLEGEIYTVPSEIDGITVTSIGDYVYASTAARVRADKLVIPDTVTYIGAGAFKNSSFKNLLLPESLVFIDTYAFAQCWNFKSLVIPDSVKKLGKGVFALCSTLKTVTLGSGIRELPEQCFRSSNSLTTVNNSENISYIGDYAFFECNNLKELRVNETVKFGKKFFGFVWRDDFWDSEDDYIDLDEVIISERNYHIDRYKLVVVQTTADRYIYGSDGIMAYAYENDIPAELSISSELINNKQVRHYSLGQNFRVTVDGKQVTGWKSNNSKAVKISDKGNTLILNYDTNSKGTFNVKTTLSNGKEIKVFMKFYGHPQLNRAKLEGGSSPYVWIENDVRSVSLKKGKSVDLIVEGRAKSVGNKYKSTKIAKIIAEPKSDLIRVYGAKKGTTTLAVTVNGYKIKLKVKVK